MKIVEQKLIALENEKLKIGDANATVDYLSAAITQEINGAINTANKSDSIDERIKSLVDGLQSILNIVNSYSKNRLNAIAVIETKISVLEEILDSQISNEIEENPGNN